MDGALERLERPGEPALALRRLAGRGPTLVWLSGYGSDMAGTKATDLFERARAAGRAVCLFDYSGCGASEGRFADGTIGRWRADALDIIDRATQGPLILVGSSMGGWIALLAALARPQRVAGLCLIAPAPDFTQRVRAGLDDAARAHLAAHGRLPLTSSYAEGLEMTAGLLDEGAAWHLMHGLPIAVRVPVRILHGQRDDAVPWEGSLELAGRLEADDVRVVLVKDGDHRLSRPQDLDLLWQALA